MRNWRYGVSSPEQVATIPGMAFLQAMLSGELPAPPISQALDFEPVAFGPGHAVFEGRPDERYYNPIGSVHGGYAATLLDSCMGCAVHSLLQAGEGYTTVELKVTFVRAITQTTGQVRAIGTAYHRGRRMAFAEGKLVDVGDRLLAHATTSCLIFPSTSSADQPPGAHQ